MAINDLNAFEKIHDEKVVDANREVKVGIIGTGWIAEAHALVLQEMEDVELCALADLVPGKAEAFKERFHIDGAKCYLSHKEMIDDILKEVKLTPGDLTYLKHHDVLYVTLSSAHKLPEEIVNKVDSFTTKMLDEVNGKTSLWVLEDPSLIGGLKLRIGDTVYDCTVLEDLYRYEKIFSYIKIIILYII